MEGTMQSNHCVPCHACAPCHPCNQSPAISPIAMQLAQAGFVLTDMILYLDTHPNDRCALDYYAKKLEQYEQVHQAYVQQVGPVTVCDVDARNGWSWGETPWPWEG